MPQTTNTHGKVALGFRAHSGWAVAVAVAVSPSGPIVVLRRRLETADPKIPGSKQPFHAAEELPFPKGQTLIQKCRDSSEKLALDAVSLMVAELKASGNQVVSSAIVTASGRPLPDLAAILKSHTLLHTAEGEFFREVLAQASESCSLPVTKIREREVWDKATTTLRLRTGDLQQRINELGRSLGPPWRQDEKLATLAAWIALVSLTSDGELPSR